MAGSCSPAAPSSRTSSKRRATKGFGRNSWAGNEVANMTLPLDVDRIREDFPILHREVRGKPLVYLDSSNTSQKPRQMIDAITEYYERHNANLYRAVYALTEETTSLFEETKKKLARFISAPDPACIVFNRKTTKSLNL